jgi:hypothetical protein
MFQFVSSFAPPGVSFEALCFGKGRLRVRSAKRGYDVEGRLGSHENTVISGQASDKRHYFWQQRLSRRGGMDGRHKVGATTIQG